jgi:protein-disulfide isomerase
MLKTYVEPGLVQYIYRNFPLTQIHPQAQKAAEAAECAGEQGKYWGMHEALFGNQDQWSGNSNALQVFKTLAGDLGVDQTQFDACLDDGKYASKVSADLQEGLAQGVTGTPAFRINGAEVSGAQPFSVFQEQIDYYLAGGQAPTLEVTADSYRSLGQADAPVVVTEFSDYQCPACAQVEQLMIPEMIAQYVDTGKVRFVYREFPISSIHPDAQKAAEAAVCAGEQGNYWDMHQKLFASQSEWTAEGVDPASFFKGYAQEMGLDTAAFSQCLDSGAATMTVRGEMMAGQEFGVNATPFFFVNDLPIRGGLPIEMMGRIIDYESAGGPMPAIVPQGEDWHVLGNRQTARAITVAFADYASPESAQHALEVLPQLKETYIDTGQLIYIFHPWSPSASSPSAQAAVAAECAGKLGKFWEMHDRLFTEQEAWTASSEPRTLFAGYAQSLGLDAAEFETCLDSEWARLRVEEGSVIAAIYGVPGAPVFLFNNGEGQQGSPTFEEFQTTIDSILDQ